MRVDARREPRVAAADRVVTVRDAALEEEHVRKRHTLRVNLFTELTP